MISFLDSIEEIYNKIKNRKYFKSFLEQIKCIKEHWNIDDIEICEDLLKNASDSIKKVAIFTIELNTNFICLLVCLFEVFN